MNTPDLHVRTFDYRVLTASPRLHNDLVGDADLAGLASTALRLASVRSCHPVGGGAD
jgi:hypothetical protein